VTQQGNPDFATGYPYPHPEAPHDPANWFPFDHSCKDHCSGHGECVSGKCVCEKGFHGDACDTATCPDSCSNHGYCTEGVCDCLRGWTGDNCGTSTCPNGCISPSNGLCFQGDCYCLGDWAGIDCSISRWGAPGIPRPAPIGYPVNTRVNSSCIAVQVPPELKAGGPPVAIVNITILLNETCVKARSPQHREDWNQGKYIANRTIIVGSGSQIICDTVQGCDDIFVGVLYKGSSEPLVFNNGVAKPSPSPMFVPGQVDVAHCDQGCSNRGVCLNYTTSYGEQYACQCKAPWIPPCCCTVDHPDPSSPIVDPMKATIGEIPFNRVPCSQSDSCFACDQTMSQDNEWTSLPAPQSCIWNSIMSRCVVSGGSTRVNSRVCRASKIPELLAPPSK